MTPAWNARNFLIEVILLRDRVPSFARYPFSIPAIRDLDRIALERPVTFLVGENGAGKSTLLEAIAVGCRLNPEGGSRNHNFSTRASHSPLAEYLRLARSPRRMADSFFLRAESYYNVATEIERLDRDDGAPTTIANYGGRSLHEQSHGESFFALFAHRLRGPGFYLLDEPEAALSPSRQLAFLSRLHELVENGSQFLIATHSPILMAYPDADILLLDAAGPPRVVAYRDTEHYQVTRNFLTRTEPMLDILLDRGPTSGP